MGRRQHTGSGVQQNAAAAHAVQGGHLLGHANAAARTRGSVRALRLTRPGLLIEWCKRDIRQLQVELVAASPGR
jgi:hypothetical protein